MLNILKVKYSDLNWQELNSTEQMFQHCRYFYFSKELFEARVECWKLDELEGGSRFYFYWTVVQLYMMQNLNSNFYYND